MRLYDSAIPILFVLLFSSLAVAVYYGTKATLNRKPGVPYFPGGENPNSVLFGPHQLTPIGLKARRVCFAALALIGTSLIAGLIIAMCSGIRN